jgi:hypothetical protein
MLASVEEDFHLEWTKKRGAAHVAHDRRSDPAESRAVEPLGDRAAFGDRPDVAPKDPGQEPMSEATRRRSGHGRRGEMDLGRARSLSLRTVQAVPDTIMPAGHDAFQMQFTERLRNNVKSAGLT